MLSKKMKMLLSISVVTFQFVMTANVRFAIMGIEQDIWTLSGEGLGTEAERN